MKRCLIVANFGGPRNLNEIEPFLKSLLCDKDVVRTKLPKPLHNLLFSYIAKKRCSKVSEDYKIIGGGSPIYYDTESIGAYLQEKLGLPVFAFHRYLPKTHALFIEQIKIGSFDEIIVFPLFPQFTYATTGSIARFFQTNFGVDTCAKIRWIKSYPQHPAFVKAYQNNIENTLHQNNLSAEECHFLYSAHGLPEIFVNKGDLYLDECKTSFQAIHSKWKTSATLCFQSKFGKGEWLKPYTLDICEKIEEVAKEKKAVLIIPLSFTSDHIETLFEIQELYIPLIQNKGYLALRVPSLNQNRDWLEGCVKIIEESDRCNNSMLIY